MDGKSSRSEYELIIKNLVCPMKTSKLYSRGIFLLKI